MIAMGIFIYALGGQQMEKNVAHENAGYTPDLVCLYHFCTQLHVTKTSPFSPTMPLWFNICFHFDYQLFRTCVQSSVQIFSHCVFSKSKYNSRLGAAESPVEEREGVWRRARFSRLRDVVPAAIGRARCCAWNLAGPGVRCSRRSAKCISLALRRISSP